MKTNDCRKTKTKTKMYGNVDILAIDPGTKRCGWAVFSHGELVASGVWVAEASDDWMKRMDQMLGHIRFSIVEHSIIQVVVEQPQMFGSTLKGCAARNSGSVMKLQAMVFSIRMMVQMLKKRITLLPVTKWKGQTPKSVTLRRIHRAWGVVPIDDNEADAIGIGTYFLKH